MPKSHPISDLRFWSHANNLLLPARIFCSCRNKMKKTNSIKDVDPLMKNALETGLNHIIHIWRIKFSGSNHSKWDDFFFLFILDVVKTSWAGRLTFINFSVMCAVSCRFLRCCSYMRKAQVNFLICKRLHDPWQIKFRLK